MPQKTGSFQERINYSQQISDVSSTREILFQSLLSVVITEAEAHRFSFHYWTTLSGQHLSAFTY